MGLLNNIMARLLPDPNLHPNPQPQLPTPNSQVGQLDNRGSHFYLAKYWAEALAKHNDAFVSLADELSKYEGEIMSDLIECQGKPQDIGGYYMLDDDKANATMRPSAKFNELIDGR